MKTPWKTLIKKGFRLTVESWENDGDHERSIFKDGLTKQEVEDTLTILKFYEKGFWEGGLGNVTDYDYDEYHTRIDNLVLPLEAAKRLNITESDHVTELAYEYMGSGEYISRVFDGFTVEYTPEDIEFKDVTKSFNL